MRRIVETMVVPKGGYPLPEDGGPIADDRVQILDTVRIKDPDVEGGILINKSAYNADEHELFDGGESDATARRTAALRKLPADKVKAIAAKLGVEAKTKDEAIAAILAAEFPETSEE